MKILFPMSVLLAMALAGCTANAPKPTAAPITPTVAPVAPVPAPVVDAEPSNPDVLARKETFIADTSKRYGIPESDIRAVLAFAADLVNYLDYMGEPARNQRINLGMIVLIFLGVLFVFAYLLKREYWKDIH